MTYLLTKEVYGQYQFVLSVLSLASVAALPGMRPAIVRAVAKGFDSTYKAALKLIFKRSLLGSVGILIFTIYGLYVGRDQ